MINLTPTQQQLLTLLSDGLCHSGNELGALLGVSRTAIWKHIQSLEALNVPLKRHPHKGYQLTAPLQLLNEARIRQQLAALSFHEPLGFHLFASIDSTNRFLLTEPSTTSLTLCCAETQTAGRGRFGRTWTSPFGENIYCSFKWQFQGDLSRLSGLSLVVSLAVLAALKTYAPINDILIKWPNDLLWQHRKLSGILVEVQAESHYQADVVIGIGLNVNAHTLSPTVVDKPWCALIDIINQPSDRNVLLALIINELYLHLQRFACDGLMPFLQTWQAVDYLAHQFIHVSLPHETIEGHAQGINAQGQLLLKDKKGQIQALSSGEASLSKLGRK